MPEIPRHVREVPKARAEFFRRFDRPEPIHAPMTLPSRYMVRTAEKTYVNPPSSSTMLLIQTSSYPMLMRPLLKKAAINTQRFVNVGCSMPGISSCALVVRGGGSVGMS